LKFSHVFISRPRQEAEELAALLAPLGLQVVLQPAFEYLPLDVRATDPAGAKRCWKVCRRRVGGSAR
jgi:uroporphyrinogen-III synthase